MLVSNLRPLLLLLAGAAIGSLVTIGLLNHKTSVAAKPVYSDGDAHPPPSLARKEQKVAPDNAQETDANSEQTEDAKAEAPLRLAERQVPMRPLPTPTIAFQTDGLPVGVRPDAGISDVYKRLPGVQPPLINRDGRDLGPEALQMLQTPREEVPFPGGWPSSSATPMPIPQTLDEINRQAQMQASPTQ
jgi:hypothetical protein